MHSKFTQIDWKHFGYFDPSISEIYYGLFSDSEDLREVAKLHFYELPEIVVAELVPCITEGIENRSLSSTTLLFVLETLLATANWVTEDFEQPSSTEYQSKIEQCLKSDVSVFSAFLHYEYPAIRRVAVELIATVDKVAGKMLVSQHLAIEADAVVQRKLLELAAMLNCTNIIAVIEEFVSHSNRTVGLQAAISFILLCKEAGCDYSSALALLTSEIVNPKTDSRLFRSGREIILSVAREGLLPATRRGIEIISKAKDERALPHICHMLILLFNSNQDSPELRNAQRELLSALIADDNLWDIDNTSKLVVSNYTGLFSNLEEILSRFNLPTDRPSLTKYIQGQKDDE
ncbi:MAG: hypothetical protein KDA84_15630 [Planctomycetaceae bacterium]|nr:hypothetical protein [Planctomycetaceae bacterium]